MEASMSTIRFVHTDFLRLATPVSGISDSPGWLQKLGGNCVRQAVRNVIDTAITQEVDFLLVAGGITESSVDLPACTAWLDQQFERLRENGIRIIVNSRTEQEAAILQPICDSVIRGQSRLVASLDPNGHLQFGEIHRPFDPAREELVIHVGSAPAETGRTVYHARPSLQPSDDVELASRNGYLALSAGAVQAVTPAETLEHGCLVIEANTVTRELKSQFFITDVLRFATEELNLSSAITIDSLASAVANASNSIGRMATQTVVIDWHVNAELVSELSDVARFGEFELLHRLRADVQSGHRGVWPRRIEFTSTSSLQVTSPVIESVEEYVQLVSGSVRSFDLDRFTHRRRMLHGESGVAPELIAGLSLLGRVA